MNKTVEEEKITAIEYLEKVIQLTACLASSLLAVHFTSLQFVVCGATSVTATTHKAFDYLCLSCRDLALTGLEGKLR